MTGRIIFRVYFCCLLGACARGVQDTYDRYAYHAEKEHAFEALMAHIEPTVNPPADVVVPIQRREA
jgi:hypothetical protein